MKHWILNFIPTGKMNSKTRAQLCIDAEQSDRTVRKMIEIARKDGHIIINMQDGRGYYLPSENPTDAEMLDLEHYHKQERSRALSTLAALKTLRRLLKDAGKAV